MNKKGPKYGLQNPSTVKIVLLGKSGAGKSSTGNTILGREAFVEDVSSESVTVKCELHAVEREGKSIAVIDTPGIFSPSQTNEELKSEVEKCLSLGDPGPCVFLLVISLSSRFTEEERNAVKWILENFGEDISVFTIVLFTHADQLKEKTVEDYIRESLDLRRIVNKCGWRFHVINNEDRACNSQVLELLEKMYLLVKTNGKHQYRKGFYEEAQKNLREVEERRKKEEEEKDGIIGWIRRVKENPSQFVKDKVVSLLNQAGYKTAAAGVGILMCTGFLGYTVLLGAIVYGVKRYYHRVVQ